MEVTNYDGIDSSNFQNLTTDSAQMLERPIIIKRWNGYTQPAGTSAAQGIVPVASYIYISTPMQFGQVTGRDIISGGGQYILGDVNIISPLPLFEANKKSGTEKDALIVDGSTYTIVGRIFRIPLAGGTWNYSCVAREVGVGA